MQEVAGLSDSKKKLLERYLRGEQAEVCARSTAIPRRPSEKYAPLSFSQQQVWVSSNLAGAIPVYNETMTVVKRGPIDPAILERAIAEIIRRHEIWRTTFDVDDGQPVQLVLPASDTLQIPRVDLTALPEAQRKNEAVRLATEEAKQPFDLGRGPLLRATLYKLNDDDHRLFMVFHHIIFDGMTAYRVFLPELAVLYRAFSEGKPSPLPDPPIQYADFASWQRQQAQRGTYAKHREYWKERLQGELPVLAWPNDFPRPAGQTHRGILRKASLDQDLIQPLRALSQQAGCSLYTTLLAAMSALLHRYTGQTDIILGGLSACRRSPESEGLLGCFMNPLPLRIDLSGNPTFRDLLARVREVVLGALDHEEMPFEQIVDELRLQPDPSRNPLFQMIFALEPDVSPVDSQWDLTLEDVSSGASKVDLSIVLDDRGGRISGPVVYNPDLFEDSTITRLMAHWNALLRSALTDPGLPISLLQFMAPEEKQQILYDWNRTAVDYPKNSCVHELFEVQAERTPDNCALVFDKQEINYRELNRRANQLAHRLIELGVGPDVVVGICGGRSIEMIVGLLGILKAGGAYLSLDPEYPETQLTFMLRDCGVRFVVVSGESGAHLPDEGITLVQLDHQGTASANTSSPAVRVRPTDLAYVMYTSGSTGDPKGVEIEHRGIVRLLFGTTYFDLDESKTMLQFAPFTFDASTLEIWGALLHGAKCVLFPGRVPSIREFGEMLARNSVTTAAITASWFNLIMDEEPQILGGLRQLAVVGEPLSVSHIRRAWDQLPNVELINGYGPTEATTFACCHTIRHCPSPSAASIPIGAPIANTECYILDRNLQPVPVGIKGELYIGGPGLARGYRNRPDLTRASFVPHPFGDGPGSRLYKTGDLARFLPDGSIDCLERVDNQVKIRGFRVELGQVETVLRKHPKVQDVACIVAGENSGKHLVAYLVFRNGLGASSSELREFVRKLLPPYMLPDKFVTLDAIPLGRTGKVDRRSLPMLNSAELAPVSPSTTPQDAVENELLQIWEGLLSRQSIRRDDNFFDLGGNSLLAAKLLVRIGRAFGKRLSFASLFAAPTIAQLAVLVRAEDTVAYSKAIQSKGNKPPFFCIGGGLLFRSLVDQLGTDQPFITVGLGQGAIDKLKTPYTLEEIARYLLDAIRRRQPNGPYYLGGFCEDGLYAYEVARQLVLSGQKVGLLVLFETVNPAPQSKGRLITRWRRMTIRWESRRAQLSRLGVSGFPRFLRLQTTHIRKRTASLRWRASYRAHAMLGNPRLNKLENILHIAGTEYKPKPLSSPTLLFRCGEWPIASAGDPYFGWSHLLTGWNEVIEIPGDHVGIFRQEGAKQMAEQMKLYMQKAETMNDAAPTKSN